MKPKSTLLLAVAITACSAGASFGQTAAGPETAISAAVDEARAAVAASPAKPISSCPDAQQLETPFELAVMFADGRKPLNLSFEYAGCEEVGRNDYLPPYTERSYKGADGYGLTIVTNDGASSSEVLVSKGRDWVGRLGTPENEALLSGKPLTGEVAVNDGAVERKGKAALRAAVKRPYPQLEACEAADWSKEAVGARSLMLLTTHAAYYYHEDCDICAAVTRCDLATGLLTGVLAEHSVSCADMKPFATNVVYDACAGGR